MRFIDLYEADEQQPNQNNTENKLKVYKTYEEAIKNEDLIVFMQRIRQGATGGTFNILNIGSKEGDVKVIKFKCENRITSSDKFRDFRNTFINKYGKDTWLNVVQSNANKITANYNNKESKHWLFDVFCALIANDGLELTPSGKIANNKTIRESDRSTFGTEQDYKKLGQAMVFYSAKFLSKAANEETDIGDPKKFAYIMQGVFGEASSGNTNENDSFLNDGNLLMKLGGIKAKMQIDAAKAVIYSKTKGNYNNDQGYRRADESFNYKDYLDEVRMTLKLITESEVDDSENKKHNAVNSKYGTPVTLADFSNKADIALEQAMAVRSAHPKEFDIEYEKLKASFDEGLEDYQTKLRDKDTVAKGELENPITGKIEKIGHSGFGTGGPNGFIRKNPKLQKLCDDIKNQDWNVFNIGPKLLLKFFDALETGGEILQKFCDDMAKSWKGLKDLMAKLDPKAIQRETDKLIKDNDKTGAMEYNISCSMLATCGIYKFLSNPHITVYTTQHAVSTMDESDKHVAEPLLKKNAAKYIEILNGSFDQSVEEYLKWKEMADKRNENVRKRNKDKEKDKKQDKPAENASYKPSFRSLVSLLNEDDTPEAEGANTAVDDQNKDTAKDNKQNNSAQNNQQNSTDNVPQEEKEIPTTLKLKTVWENIKNDYEEASSDVSKNAENIVKALRTLSDLSDEDKQRYLNDDFSNVSNFQSHVNDNSNEIPESFKIKPIDLSYVLTESDLDGEGTDDDEPQTNTEGGTSPSLEGSSAPAQEKSSQENKSTIENIAKDTASSGIADLANAVESIGNADIITPDLIKKVIDLTSKEESVVQGIKLYQEAAKKLLEALRPCEKIVTLDNQVAYIDQTIADDYSSEFKEANFNIIGKNIEKPKEEEELNSDSKQKAKVITDYAAQLNTVTENVFKNVIQVLHNACDHLDKTAEPTGKPEDSIKDSDIFMNLKDRISNALNTEIKNAENAIMKFCADQKLEKTAAAYKEQFNFIKGDTLHSAPKIVYFMNVVNVAKTQLTGQIKTISANLPKGDPTKDELKSLEQKYTIQPPTDEAVKIDTLIAGFQNLSKQYDIEIVEPTKIDKSKINRTLGNLIGLSKKAIAGFAALFPANPKDGIYWKIAAAEDPKAGQNELKATYKKLQDSIGNTYMTIKNNKSSSFIFGLRTLKSFLTPENKKEHKALCDFIEGCLPDIDKLENEKTGRDVWDLIAYLSAADSIFKRLGQATNLTDNDFKIIYDGANAGNKDASQDGKEKTAQVSTGGQGAQKLANDATTSANNSNNAPKENASYIPEFSPDMLINEIYKYIRGN